MRQFENTKGVSVPYYGVAILWVLLTVLRQSHHLILVMLLSVITFTLLRLINLKDDPLLPPDESDIEAETIKSSVSQSGQELQKGLASVQALQKVMAQIQNSIVCEKIFQLEILSRRILNEVEERPEKAPKIRTFVDYYFPTTLNLLNSYRRAEAAGIEGENITRTKRQIEDMLDSPILVVFSKQLDSLFGSDALDISTDLAVLQNMMLREGIPDGKPNMESGNSQDDMDIRLML